MTYVPLRAYLKMDRCLIQIQIQSQNMVPDG